MSSMYVIIDSFFYLCFPISVPSCSSLAVSCKCLTSSHSLSQVGRAQEHRDGGRGGRQHPTPRANNRMSEAYSICSSTVSSFGAVDFTMCFSNSRRNKKFDDIRFLGSLHTDNLVLQSQSKHMVYYSCRLRVSAFPRGQLTVPPKQRRFLPESRGAKGLNFQSCLSPCCEENDTRSSIRSRPSFQTTRTLT